MKRHESGLSGKPPDDRLTILYHRVLDFAKSDHETALLYARKYGEAFCREMGAGVGDGPNSRPRSIEDLLRELSARNLAPRELIAHLRTIQAYGNAAAHEHADGPVSLSEQDLRPCIDAVLALQARALTMRAQDQLSMQLAAPEHEAEVRVASSKLTVVRAIELGWNLESELLRYGLKVATLSYPWSDRILDDLAAGHIDLAIYNRARAAFAIEQQGIAVAILGCFGHSMGGRNFYLLARASSPWAAASRDTLPEQLCDVTIAVPYGSDIIENVELALGGDRSALETRGIRFIHVPANAGLEIFNIGHDILVSAGQNLRMLARFTGGYEEVVSFGTLSASIRDIFLQRSENCLLASEPFAAKLRAAGSTDLFDRLRRNFFITWHDPRHEDALVRSLSSLIDLDGITIDLADRISRNILFETYRIGRP